MSQDFEIKILNQLSFPKIGYPLCDLTGHRAAVQLLSPHVSLFYASREIAEQAWFGIMSKIGHLIGPLQMDAPLVGTSEERARREKSIEATKRSIIEFCLSESSKLMSMEKYPLAIPAAIQALKFCRDLDGDKSISVVEPNLHLGQSFLSVKEYNKALENLTLARWIVLNRSDECSNKTRSRLHMLLGRVQYGLGNHEDAKEEFASSIFYSSRDSGPETIATSMGFYRLGEVFLIQGNIDPALAFFDKVVDIWYKYFTNLHRSLDPTFKMLPLKLAETKTFASNTTLEELNDEVISDGRRQLEHIFENRRRILGAKHIAVGEAQYTIGVFEYFLLNNLDLAEECITGASAVYENQLGKNHPSCAHVREMLKIVNTERLKQEIYDN